MFKELRVASCVLGCAVACSGGGAAEQAPAPPAGGAAGSPANVMSSAGSSAGSAVGGTSSGNAGSSGSPELPRGGDASGGINNGTAGTAGTAGGNGGSGGGGGSTGIAGGAGSSGGGGGTPGGFVHPGILVNAGMLDFVKGKLTSSAAPWQAALDAASQSKFGALAYQAHPRDDVQCGPTSMPDIGCTDEKNDVIAAYTHALLWYYTGQKPHAAKAIEIMNAWSAVLVKHSLDNEQLQAAWCAEIFPRAAEIIRYSNAGWLDADVKKFEQMLRTAYLPEVKDGSTRTGNWDTSAIDAALNIAVFLDDHTEFDKAIALWRARTPAYIYLSKDGASPVQPPREAARSASALASYWWNPKQFVDGISQESCRDRPGGGTPGFGHAQYGVAALLNAAETARIQGVDLFQPEQARFTAFLELHSKYLNGASTSALCNSTIETVGADPMWDIGYNAYANVLGQPLPETKQLLGQIRPTDATHHMAWETLTHGDIGAAGL